MGRSGHHPALGRVLAFKYALTGIRHAAGEPNFRIQLGAGIGALILGVLLHVSSGDWLALILVSLAVLLMEMINTAIEALTDLASSEYTREAAIAKDVAAGAVLLASVGAVVVGVYIFLPPLLHLAGIKALH